MNRDLVCTRYARALMMAAQQDVRTGQRMARECLVFLDHYNRGLKQMLDHPAFSGAERQNILSRIVEEHGFLPVTARFLQLLHNRSRMQLFPDIFRLFRALLDEQMGRIVVSVVSSHALPSELFTEYRRKIQAEYGESALIRQVINPALVGGVRIRVGNKLIDGSLEGSIRRMCDRLNIRLDKGGSHADSPG